MKTKSYSDKKPIFSIREDPKYVSYRKARDAYDYCENFTETEKKAYYNDMGIDGENVEKYLETLEILEDGLYPEMEIVIIKKPFIFPKIK
jgi:hypothetical protein